MRRTPRRYLEFIVALSAHPAAPAAAAPPAAAACSPFPSGAPRRFLAADDLTPAERWQRHLAASRPPLSASEQIDALAVRESVERGDFNFRGFRV